MTKSVYSNITLDIKKTKVQNRSTKNDPIIKEIPMACADEKSAVEFLEEQRWGDMPVCPCCGSVDVYQMQDSKNSECAFFGAPCQWLIKAHKQGNYKTPSQGLLHVSNLVCLCRIHLRQQ